jgi:hypothetical protein
MFTAAQGGAAKSASLPDALYFLTSRHQFWRPAPQTPVLRVLKIKYQNCFWLRGLQKSRIQIILNQPGLAGSLTVLSQKSLSLLRHKILASSASMSASVQQSRRSDL